MAEIDDTLRMKFEQIQMQQQQKLLKRKELKQKQKVDQESSLKTEQSSLSAFGVDDDLDLRTEDPPEKSAPYLSEELVEHLNDQIRELKDENGRLFKLLSERDYQIRQLKKRREEDKLAFTDSTLSSDSAATRIVELSKKVRELNAALERKKTESKQLFGRCRHLENELAKTSEVISPRLSSVVMTDDVSPRSRPENENELKQLNDKLKQAEQRNAEYRNQVQSIKTELKMAQKVIGNEVGEGVNFHDLLNANSNWRGRAQQILGLQKKIGELKSQLDQQQIKTSRTSRSSTLDDELEAEFMGAPQSKVADMKHRDSLRKLEKEKKEQLERAGAELKALEADYSTLKQKLDASKARNKVLANENKAIRGETQKLVDKGMHDDELISALIAQQANMKTMIEELTLLQKENQQSQADRMSAITAKNQQENNVIQQLKAIVSEKEAKVKQLEQDLMQLKQAKVEEQQRNSVTQLFDRPSTAQSVDDSKAVNQEPLQTERSVIKQSLESSVSSQPEFSATTADKRPSSGRPASGRNSSRATHSRPPSKRAASRTGSSLSQRLREEDQLTDLRSELQEYKSLAKATEVERDRLMELLQLTQKRLDEANEQTLHHQNEMKAHKQNAVQLEKIVGKMKLENPGGKASAGVQRKREKTNMSNSMSFGSSSDMRGTTGYESKVNELEGALSLQKDENEALKAALESTLQAKEEDLKIYNEMIDQTKLIFIQGLRELKNKTN